MDDYIKYLKFISGSDKTEDKHNNVEILLSDLQGIKKVTKQGTTVSVEFNSYVLSESVLIELLKENGYESEKLMQNKKGFFAKWLEKTAKTNKENFGNNRLECCDLNK
ncbi:MAG: hypothetical protein L3J56_04480 [Bacteroidales bacterium]|nr:hypothetical protein [Bacteroidales bacterium]